MTRKHCKTNAEINRYGAVHSRGGALRIADLVRGETHLGFGVSSQAAVAVLKVARLVLDSVAWKREPQLRYQLALLAIW